MASYQEQDSEKVAAYQEEIKDIPPKKITYVDECDIDTYLYREYGNAPRDQQVFGQIHGRRYKRCGIVAAKMGESDSCTASVSWNNGQPPF